MVTMYRIALVRASDGLVTNVCLWDRETPWNDLPPDISTHDCPDEVCPGWSLIDGEWIAPPPVTENPSE